MIPGPFGPSLPGRAERRLFAGYRRDHRPRPAITQAAAADGLLSARGLVRSPADSSVDELTDKVSMPVVAGVLLDHVGVDPPQGAGLAVPQPGVIQAAGCGRCAAGLALGLLCPQISLPVSVIERDELAVLDSRVRPDRRRIGLRQQHSPEPVPLNLGHMPH